MKKRWKIKSSLKKTNGSERQEEIKKILLKNRGITSKKLKEDFFDPLAPWDKKVITEIGVSKAELSKAIKRIKKAIKDKESIIVYGDYDADGISATAILWEMIYSLGAKVLPFIPHREEHGYGISKKGIDDILKKSNDQTVNLIITVDNGIVAHESIEYANKKGIDVIVTDHHQPKLTKVSKGKKKKVNLPKAQSIVWSDKVSGAGVSWVLASELAESLGKSKKLSKESIELAAIGTIGDLMPVIGPNRSIVKFGLLQLNKTERIGLKALIKEAILRKGKIESWHIGYILSPRLNAMGRLTTALDSLRLLCTKDHKRAEDLAVSLGMTNKERQGLTYSTFEHAKESSISQLADKTKSSKILLIADESYNQGVIGLVAGKLVEHYYRPSIVISKGKIYSKASVRSVNGFNIIEYLRTFEELYEDIGGHPMAAGFTIKTEKLSLLKKKLEELAEKKITKELLTPVLKADCEIKLSDINFQLFNQLKKFAPFGIGNPQPLFVSRELEVASFRLVGNDGKHLKMSLKDKKSKAKNLVFDAIAFGHGKLASKLSHDKKIDIMYTIEEDTWNGNEKLQLKVRDLKIVSSTE